jgi:phytoene synthase
MAARSSDLASVEALLRGGSRSFHLAGRLLPRVTRSAATALYAFCRLADDAIDGPARSDASLPQLRARLDRVYAATPLPLPVERLLACTVRSCGIPRGLLDALLEGFEWDGIGRRYETIEELRAYSARVAGSVGVMMTLMMNVRQPAVLAKACELGIAMQLTNIARDVGEDARAGRLYLPCAWLREAGIDPESWLAQPTFTPALAGVIERLLVVADATYARATLGIAYLPARARAGIHAARRLYAEIGEDLRRHGLDSVARRAHVGRRRKLWLLLVACADALSAPRMQLSAQRSPDAEFLLEAVRSMHWPDGSAGAPYSARRPDQGRAEWVIELFTRLEHGERGAAREVRAG